MKTPALCALAAAACALLASGSAVAASSATASATLSNIQIQLFDLDPTDGITPSISFVVSGSQPNFGSASASWQTTTGSASANSTFFRDAGPWKPGSATATTAFSHSVVGLSGNNTASGSTLSATGTSTSPGDAVYIDFPSITPSGSFSGDVRAPDWSVGFELSANTVAVFSAVGAASAEAIEGGLVVYPWFTSINGNWASAQVSLSVNGPTASGGWQSATDSFSASAQSWYDDWAGTWFNGFDSRTGTLGVSFLNLGASTLNGNFFAQVSMNGVAYGNVTPVPEPGRVALMLAGLLVVASVVRRRAA
jgi:hypothetical protein